MVIEAKDCDQGRNTELGDVNWSENLSQLLCRAARNEPRVSPFIVFEVEPEVDRAIIRLRHLEERCISLLGVSDEDLLRHGFQVRVVLRDRLIGTNLNADRPVPTTLRIVSSELTFKVVLLATSETDPIGEFSIIVCFGSFLRCNYRLFCPLVIWVGIGKIELKL